MTTTTKALLPRELETRLTDTCRRRRPAETCGILFGVFSDDVVAVSDFTVVRNAASQSGQAFAFEPVDWIRAFYDAQKNRQRIVGFFHSHPGGSIFPSAADDEGWIPWGTYWIVGLQEDGTFRIAAYCRDPDHAWRQLRLED